MNPTKTVRIDGRHYTVPRDELTDPHPDQAGGCRALEPEGEATCTLRPHAAAAAHIAHDGNGDVIAIWHTRPCAGAADGERISASSSALVVHEADDDDGPRYMAHFTAEAWQRDQAVEVDPLGPAHWDCTRYARQHAGYLAALSEVRHESPLHHDGVLDNDDVFRNDPAAPEWVRYWRGPFTIRITMDPDAAVGDRVVGDGPAGPGGET
jgi:hypothetical protein